MKHCLTAVLSLAAIVMLWSCHSQEKEMEKVAYGYLMATGNYMIDDAMPYATKATREVTLPFLKNTLIPLTDTNYIISNTPATIKITEIALGNDTAAVSYVKTTPLKTQNSTIYMIKEDGKWLVDVPLQLPDFMQAATPTDTASY